MTRELLKIKVRESVQRQVTPVGRGRLESSWWGRSEGNCCNQHCLILAAMKTTRKFTPKTLNPAHLAFPPTPLMFIYSSWGLEED